MRIRITLCLLISAIALSPAADAGDPPDIARTQRASAWLVDAWLAEARATSTEQENSWIRLAGDVDGDDRTDVAVFTARSSEDEDGGSSLIEKEMTIRRGATGAELWRYVIRADEPCPSDCPSGTLKEAEIVPARLAGGRDGFIAYRWWTDVARGLPGIGEQTTLAIDVRGLDHTGTETWQVVRSGTITETDGEVTVDSVPQVRLSLDGRPGPADDVLVGSRSGEYSSEPSHEETEWHEEFELVDGGDGSVADAGSRDTREESFSARHDLARFMRTPDISGDGLDDFLIQDSWPPASTGAFQGADGTPLWTASGWSWASEFLDDMTGDGRVDLLADSNLGDQRAIALVDGATGKAVWRRVSDNASVGAGGEIWLSRLDSDERTHHAVATVVGRDGSTQRTVERTYTLPAGQTLRKDETFTGGLFVAGDVDADGTSDLNYSVTVYRQATEPGGSLRAVTDEETISGRTGRTLWTGRVGASANTSFDGRGDDFVHPVFEGDTVTVSPQEGDTGRLLWHASIPGRYRGYWFETARFDADDRSDLLFRAYVDSGVRDFRFRLVLYSGTDGHVLWHDDFGAIDAPFPPDGHPVTSLAVPRLASANRRLPSTGCTVPAPAWLGLLVALALVRRRRAQHLTRVVH